MSLWSFLGFADNLSETQVKTNSTVETGVKTSRQQHEDDLVKKIHDEVDSLEENTIKEVEKMLSELQIPTESKVRKKAEMMKSLGFSKSNVVVQQSETIDRMIEEKQQEKEEKQACLRLINKYRLAYPNEKIVPMEEFEKVLRKYNLVTAPASFYIQDVPEKNLIEIKNAKQTEKSHIPDSFTIVTSIEITSSWSMSESQKTDNRLIANRIQSLLASKPYIFKKKTDYTYQISNSKPDEVENYHKLTPAKRVLAGTAHLKFVDVTYSQYVSVAGRTFREILPDSLKAKYTDSQLDCFVPVNVTQTEIDERKSEVIAKLLKAVGAKEERYYNINVDGTQKVDRKGLHIAAPKSHFDMSSLRSEDGVAFYSSAAAKVSHVELKDPIAFFILKGINGEEYVRIVSKWGTSDDQSYLDPTIQDERVN